MHVKFKSLFSLFLIFLLTHSVAQTNSWRSSDFSKNGLIENKGQYSSHSNFDFVAYRNDRSLYFISPQSIEIEIETVSEKSLEKKKEIEEEEASRELLAKGIISAEQFEREEKAREMEMSKDQKIKRNCSMTWVNSNVSSLNAINKRSDYISYGQRNQTTIKSRIYNELQLSNLYDQVDITYTAPAEGGVKYELTLHPGAQLDEIDIAWKGADKLEIDADGNLLIYMGKEIIIDHAPMAYYLENNELVEIKYQLTADNQVSFEVKNLKKNKTLIIDPWLTAVPTDGPTNLVVHVDTDNNGNSYVMNVHFLFNSTNPVTIHKYDANGALVWTYIPGIAFSWYGGLEVIKTSGDFYISTGLVTAPQANLEKIDATAALIYSSLTGETEPWSIQYNCTKDKLDIFGRGNIGLLDTTTVHTINAQTGALVDSALIDLSTDPSIATTWPLDMFTIYYGQEIRSSCANIYGGYFVNTLKSVAYICEGYQTLWQTGYDNELTYDGPTYQNPILDVNGASNVIASGRNFVYINRGDKLFQYTVACGTLTDSVTIPGGNFEMGDGILVDDCDNIIVGSNSGIYKYDESLNLLNSVTTDSAVFDIDFGPGNTIIASGKGFVGSYDFSHCGMITDCINIQVDGPIASVSDTICVGDSTLIAVNVANNFSCSVANSGITWSPTSGLSDPNSYSTMASPSVTTTYYISTTHMGCDTINPLTDSITIVVVQPASINAGNDVAICSGQNVQLNASGATSYLWNNVASLSNGNISNPTASPIVTTQYIVSNGSGGGCVSSDTVLVSVLATPSAGLSSNVSITEGESVTLTASGGIQYIWSPTAGLNCTNCATVTASPISTTTYCVTVIADTTLNCSDSACVTVTVVPVECKEIFVPTAFSPNGDGNNDLLFVESNCSVNSLTFFVFDRWGEKVFETTDINSGWDGLFKGKEVDNAVFSYYAKAVFTNGGEMELQGNVTVVR
jgi:gliding motility-associated-like protein